MGAVSAGTGRDKIKEKRILRTKKHHLSDGAVFSLERAMGVEPTSKAWEAFILPMNYAREHYEIHCTMKIQEVKPEGRRLIG